ncbi:hypothetical protein BVRB_6g156090 [Beta vulgaris subsp. vulgaris]|uniref:Uncharacterized protein n=1 Tax=Beta vulgaris subsp. vulgaris TaxID=3555 RepID=A0A0J8E2J8_BETVV|nr:hypothetical protein BVRB_6g156090 [Beta vulgaris subsp. vulgaris]
MEDAAVAISEASVRRSIGIFATNHSFRGSETLLLSIRHKRFQKPQFAVRSVFLQRIIASGVRRRYCCRLDIRFHR